MSKASEINRPEVRVFPGAFLFTSLACRLVVNKREWYKQREIILVVNRN